MTTVAACPHNDSDNSPNRRTNPRPLALEFRHRDERGRQKHKHNITCVDFGTSPCRSQNWTSMRLGSARFEDYGLGFQVLGLGFSVVGGLGFRVHGFCGSASGFGL